jgi:hypothetical protein
MGGYVGTANIYRIAASGLVPEDKFTASLKHLIDHHPAIGQGIVDAITQSAGLGSTKFRKAEDHPLGNAESKPDFLFSCSDFDILCEHKLESNLGERQLERYLGLKRDKPTYLVLITNRSHSVSEDVLRSKNYLRPSDSLVPHFSWERFYPIIAASPKLLAKEFAEYMYEIGMAPSPLPKNWAQLFSDTDTAEAFYDRTKELRAFFSQLGAKCQADPTRLGFQVRKPLPWLHLLYFYAFKAVQPPVTGVRMPHICVNMFVKKNELDLVRKFSERAVESIPTRNNTIVGRGAREVASWDENLLLVYECIGSLEDYLTEDPAETKARLLDFGRAVFDQVTKISK